MGSEDEIKIIEKKTKRYRLPDGIDFYVLDDTVEAETEGGLSARDIAAKGRRSTKSRTHAFIVSDPKYPTMPYTVWEEKMRETVMGTLRADTDIPRSDIPHADSISVTASSAITGGISCKNCNGLIPLNEHRCPHCGELSPAAGN